MTTKENVKQAVQELARENFNLYKEDYINSLTDALEVLKNLSEGYFENRNEGEVKEQNSLSIDLEDYKRWVSWEFCSWLNEQEEMSEFETVNQLIKWIDGEENQNGIPDNFDFHRDLYTKEDGLFSVSVPLLHEDDNINFIYKVNKEDEWESTIEKEYIESI